MKGRRPLPTQLKVVRGTLRKSRENPHEPLPAHALSADPPEHLLPEQQEVWRYVLAHAPANLLKSLDWAVLEVWVVAYDTYRKAQKEVNRVGQVVKTPNDYPVINPYLSSMNKQALIMLKAASEMGFTPASRSRITIGEDANDINDPWAKLLSGS